MADKNNQFSRKPAFICDGHLGKLCKYLRMLGFDCLFVHLASPRELPDQGDREQRIVLSRDRKLKNNPELPRFMLITSSDPLTQLHELTRQLNLENFISPLSRCLQCNGHLENVPKEQIIHKLEPGTARHFYQFFQCSNCGRLYWKGSHYQNMMHFIKTMVFHPYKIYLLRSDGTRMQELIHVLLRQSLPCSFHTK